MAAAIDTGERIAFRSTRGEGRFQKPRWTEIAVWFYPRAGDTPPLFRATITGCSSVPGEDQRAQMFNNARLGLLLSAAFGDDRTKWTAPVRAVMEQVGCWLADNRDRLEREQDAPPSYSEAQREAALSIMLDAMHGDRRYADAINAVDEIAAALGLQRDRGTARG